MNTPLDVIERVRYWITNPDTNHDVFDMVCSDGSTRYTVTLLRYTESYTMYVYCYEYDVKEDQYRLHSTDRQVYKIPSPGATSMIAIMIVRRLTEDLHVIPIIDDDYCFHLNNCKYRLDSCHIMTHILLIFQVDEVGTPISCDYMCCEEPFGPGKSIPAAIYEYLTNERVPI